MIKSSTIFLTIVILCIGISNCTQQKSSINAESSFSEDSLMGEWFTIKGDVESYDFFRDDSSYLFVGYMGGRHVIQGTWEIRENKFVITMDNGHTTAYDFRLKSDTLILNEGAEIYTKTAPIKIQDFLLNILNELSSELDIPLKYPPTPADFDWGIPSGDSTENFNYIDLKGYETQFICSSKSRDEKRITDYLLANGFEYDTNYRAITEITEIEGYWKGDHLVTLSDIYSEKNEGEIDPEIIMVFSGMIEE